MWLFLRGKREGGARYNEVMAFNDWLTWGRTNPRGGVNAVGGGGNFLCEEVLRGMASPTSRSSLDVGRS